MRKTFKYRLYPTHSQRRALNDTLEVCRWTYNQVLETRKAAWEERQETLSKFDTQKLVTAWKEDHPELKTVYAQVLQNVCGRVDLAYQGFFRRIKSGDTPGFPRFKGYGRYDSFTFPQSGFKLVDNEKRLHLSKIGDIKIKYHRPIVGEVKTLTIRRDRVGNWYANFSVVFEPEYLKPSTEVVGVDVGLKHFATLSNGEQIPNPHFIKKDEKDLARNQRVLSRLTKGTPEYRRRKKVISKIYRRIANRRKDFAHKQSRLLINRFGLIALEQLNIKGMSHNHHLAKAIMDVTWGQFARFMAYKAEEAGRAVIFVNPRNTTKMCSRCGELVDKDLSVRVHECHHCGLVLDRDLNAAINILGLGLQSVEGTSWDAFIEANLL